MNGSSFVNRNCVVCGSDENIIDISNHELRRLTMTGGYFKPQYWVCEHCLEELKRASKGE